MLKFTKTKKLGPTDLTWEEQNPFSYLLNVKVITELQQAVKKFKEKESKLSEGREHQESHASEKDS